MAVTVDLLDYPLKTVYENILHLEVEILYEHWLKISPSCLCLSVSESTFGHLHWFTETLVQTVGH